MKKIVVFTEGRGDLIFTRQILIQIIGYDNLSGECFELKSDDLHHIPHKFGRPDALIYYMIINVGTDEKVLSEIEDRHERYVNLGFEVIGLRDMFSEAYKKKSTEMREDVNNFYIRNHNEIISRMVKPEKIHFYFAIMELEAWLLGMYKNLERIDASLTPEYIKSQLGFDLGVI